MGELINRYQCKHITHGSGLLAAAIWYLNIEFLQAFLAVESLEQNLGRHHDSLIAAEQDPPALDQFGAILSQDRFCIRINSIQSRRGVLKLLIGQVEIVYIVT